MVCQWTGMCPSGDIHANDQGHVELAAAFEQVIDHLTVDTAGLPAGSVKSAYSARLKATGGNALTSGRSSRGRCHRVSASRRRPAGVVGKPTAAGVSTFTVQGLDTKDPVEPPTRNSGTPTLSLQIPPPGPGMPASGLYSTPQYGPSQVVEHTVQFSSAPDANGTVAPLLMDIFVPPDTTTSPRPTLIEVHGGSFVGGSRTDNDGDTLQWALDGYVGVTIDYRLAAQSPGGCQ